MPTPTVHRRTLLRTVASLAAAGLAGCAGDGGDPTTGGPTPTDGTPTTDATASSTTAPPTTAADPVSRAGEATVDVTVENASDQSRRITVALGHTSTPPCVLADPTCGDPSTHENVVLETVDLGAGETREWTDLSLPLTDQVDTFGAEVFLLNADGEALVKGAEETALSLFDDPDQYTWHVEDGATYEASGTVRADGSITLEVTDASGS